MINDKLNFFNKKMSIHPNKPLTRTISVDRSQQVRSNPDESEIDLPLRKDSFSNSLPEVDRSIKLTSEFLLSLFI